MCLVALYFQQFEDASVLVGANREELYARGGEPPRRLPGKLRAIGGTDPVAGGTWLGVNECGLLIAVTNRPRASGPPRPPSRGRLARDLLDSATAQEAADRAADALKSAGYAGCNFLCADARKAFVLHAADRLERVALSPGLHLLTANDVNDPADARQRFARTWLERASPRTSAEAAAALQTLCGLTGEAPMCLRGADRGTVSSAVITVREPLSRSGYFHAQGPPDETAYVDYSPLLTSIFITEFSRG